MRTFDVCQLFQYLSITRRCKTLRWLNTVLVDKFVFAHNYGQIYKTPVYILRSKFYPQKFKSVSKLGLE